MTSSLLLLSRLVLFLGKTSLCLFDFLPTCQCVHRGKKTCLKKTNKNTHQGPHPSPPRRHSSFLLTCDEEKQRFLPRGSTGQLNNKKAPGCVHPRPWVNRNRFSLTYTLEQGAHQQHGVRLQTEPLLQFYLTRCLVYETKKFQVPAKNNECTTSIKTWNWPHSSFVVIIPPHTHLF